MLALCCAPWLVSGCIIPEAPDDGAKRRSPIFIVDSSISPDPRNLAVIDRNEPAAGPTFTLTIYSDDAGEGLYVLLFFDHDRFDQFRYPAGQTLDKPRTISYTVDRADPRLGLGCHAFTLVVLHEDGWDDVAKRFIGNPTDLASVTWFTYVKDSSDPAAVPPPVTACPSSETSTTMP